MTKRGAVSVQDKSQVVVPRRDVGLLQVVSQSQITEQYHKLKTPSCYEDLQPRVSVCTNHSSAYVEWRGFPAHKEYEAGQSQSMIKDVGQGW